MKGKKIISIIVLIVLAFVSIYTGIYHGKINHMTSLDREILELLDKPTAKGKVNVLLLGVDESGLRADTIMVVSVDNENNTIKLLSIPRDTRITLNNGSVIKINAAMGMKDREEFMIETVKTVVKMPIHYYCSINFAGFIEVIDILGGIDYNVPFDMNYDDPAQNLHIHLKAGMQHLDGQAAHDFVRFRHNNKGEGVYAPGDYSKGDIGRIAAQQDFLAELFKQKMQMQYLLKAPELIDASSKYVKTNFSVTSALEFLSILKSTQTTEMTTFMLPGTDKYINNISYYIYSPSATKKLVLEEFGYPEEEAKKLAVQREAEEAYAEEKKAQEEKIEETTPMTVIE